MRLPGIRTFSIRGVAGLARLGLGTSVQVIASAGTIALTVAAARRSDPQEFGRFALGTALVIVCVGLVRAFTADPLVYRDEVYASMSSSQQRDAAGSAAIIVSIALGLGAMVIVAFSSGDIFSAAVIGAVAVSASLQDYGRVVMVAVQRGRTAMLVEAVSTAVMLAALLGSAHAGGTVGVYLSWLIASCLSATLSARLLGTRFRPRRGLAWLKSGWRSGMAYALDFGVTAGLAQASLLIATLVSGVGSAGAIKGAQVLLMPVSLMTRGVLTALVPEVVRLAHGKRDRQVRQLTTGFAVVTVAAAAATAIVSLLVPSSWLAPLLGESIRPSLSVLPWSALAIATLALATAPALVMRTYGAVAQVALTKLVSAPISVLLMILGTMTYGPAGTQAALASVNAARTFVTHVQLRRLREVSVLDLAAIVECDS